jgi:hypothetical protein
MTTEKPDPAALIHRFGALVDRLERTGVSAGRSREKADARGASIGLANYDEEEAFRQASADVRAAYAAALQPQPGADDAAALDKLVDLWDAACGDLATGPHVAAYREHRAAVLARMSTPPGYKLVPVEPTLEMTDRGKWFLKGTEETFERALARGVWDAMLAAAPTEVK